MTSNFLKIIFKFSKYCLYFLLTLFTISIVWYFYVVNFKENKNYSQEDILNKFPNGNFILVNENNIFYQHFATNTNKNIIIIGGTTAWSETWRHTIDEIKNEYNIYALDLPPFGYSKVEIDYIYDLKSQAETINKFIENLNLKNITLISHSYGAGPSMEAVLNNENDFTKFIIIDGAIHTEGSGHNAKENTENIKLAKILNKNIIKNFLTTNLIHINGFMKKSLEYLVYKDETVSDWWVETYKEPLVQKGNSEKLSNWFYDFVFRNGKALSREKVNLENIKIPVVIIWGDKDNLTPLYQGENLNKIIPNSKLEIMKDVGHIPMIDNFDGFIQILKRNL